VASIKYDVGTPPLDGEETLTVARPSPGVAVGAAGWFGGDLKVELFVTAVLLLVAASFPALS
jgi:hypothetical protein